MFVTRLAWTMILLCFPCRDDRCILPCPAFYWSRWVLSDFLCGLALNLDPLGFCQVAKITDVSHRSLALKFLFSLCFGGIRV
jgi:hypothetical protein